VAITLSPRGEAVLKSLIEAYLVQGEPVGSRLLSKLIPGSLSSATIRNVLTDLEEEGLVYQPHTSAGRVPTEKAYRHYVDRWVKPAEPGPALGAKLSEAFEGMGDPEGEAQWVRHASKVLSEAMEGICVALPTQLTTSRMVRLEFVPIGGGKLVTVWVGLNGDVEHQIMDNTWAFPAEVLVELGNFATAHFAGCSLPEMRDRLIAAVEEQADQTQQIRLRLSNVAHCMNLPEQRGGGRWWCRVSGCWAGFPNSAMPSGSGTWWKPLNSMNAWPTCSTPSPRRPPGRCNCCWEPKTPISTKCLWRPPCARSRCVKINMSPSPWWARCGWIM